MTTGKFWLHQICQFVNSKLKKDAKIRAQKFDVERWKVIFDFIQKIQRSILEKPCDLDEEKRKKTKACQLLLLHFATELLTEGDFDNQSYLDVTDIIKSEFEEQNKEDENQLKWSDVIVDILIGMLSNNLKSKPIVITVFKLIMAYLTKDAVQVLIDALSGENEDNEEESYEENFDEGQENSDVDDEEMMKHDKLLAQVFKLKTKSKVKEQKEVKEQEVAFKTRLLELVEIFVSRQSSNLTLSFIPVLLMLMQRSQKFPEETSLSEKAGILLKAKIVEMKNFSRNLNDEAVSELHDLLDTVMTSSVTSQIQVVNSTMSQCCCLILKVLISQQSDNSQFGKCDLDKLKEMYGSCLKSFMMERDSKVNYSLFTKLVNSRPKLALSVIGKDLLEYAVKSPIVFRKKQACELVEKLLPYTSSESSINAKHVTERMTSIVNSTTDDVKENYYHQVLRLSLVAVKKLDASTEDTGKQMISALKQSLQIEKVARKQNLANLHWDILSSLGETRPKVDKNQRREEKKQRKEEKKRRSEEKKQESSNKASL